MSLDPAILRQLAIAVGLGLLVGLQREHAKSGVAGIRTFALITALGAVCAQLSGPLGGWVVAAGFVALAALCVVGFLAEHRSDPSGESAGITTEVAVLLMYGV